MGLVEGSLAGTPGADPTQRSLAARAEKAALGSGEWFWRFESGLVGGPVEVLAELADAGQVGLLAARLEGQEEQVLGEAV